ncbi:hypothetical protein L596_003342 [Steinernema carpocapsae]|uniref:Uncharacterized protein n=1 Tax=Steinernema carpocapsae TaxID=34508 RepID=A0A4U8US96_STECR|nr:hypothetical protein L596_003342 [Steinernema carpocapsae]
MCGGNSPFTHRSLDRYNLALFIDLLIFLACINVYFYRRQRLERWRRPNQSGHNIHSGTRRFIIIVAAPLQSHFNIRNSVHPQSYKSFGVSLHRKVTCLKLLFSIIRLPLFRIMRRFTLRLLISCNDARDAFTNNRLVSGRAPRFRLR